MDFDQPGLATSETLIDVYEVIDTPGNEKKSNVQIFTSLTANLDKLVMSQAQIIRFCEKYPRWLCIVTGSNLFLIKVNDEYFLADVFGYSPSLGIDLQQLDYFSIWDNGYVRRVISPRLL